MSDQKSEDDPIKIVAYSSLWPKLFLKEKVRLEAVLGKWLVGEPEHIGSTAVVGLAAKPIIDIMAPVRDLESSTAAIDAAQALTYCYYPYKPELMHWFCRPSPACRTHHLHLVPWRSSLWRDRLAFRDALRQNPVLARQYEALKLELAARHGQDRDAYTEAKSAFIASTLTSWAGGQCGA